MLNWITANLSTIVISAILLAIVTSISLHLIRQKKQGRSSCGCNCAHCAMHGQCHGKQKRRHRMKRCDAAFIPSGRLRMTGCGGCRTDRKRSAYYHD